MIQKSFSTKRKKNLIFWRSILSLAHLSLIASSFFGTQPYCKFVFWNTTNHSLLRFRSGCVFTPLSTPTNNMTTVRFGLMILCPLENLVWSKRWGYSTVRANPICDTILIWCSLYGRRWFDNGVRGDRLDGSPITLYIYKIKLLSPSPSSHRPCFPNFVRLSDCESVHKDVPPWSDLPLHRILYIPFSIFAHS